MPYKHRQLLQRVKGASIHRGRVLQRRSGLLDEGMPASAAASAGCYRVCMHTTCNTCTRNPGRLSTSSPCDSLGRCLISPSMSPDQIRLDQIRSDQTKAMLLSLLGGAPDLHAAPSGLGRTRRRRVCRALCAAAHKPVIPQRGLPLLVRHPAINVRHGDLFTSLRRSAHRMQATITWWRRRERAPRHACCRRAALAPSAT